MLNINNYKVYEMFINMYFIIGCVISIIYFFKTRKYEYDDREIWMLYTMFLTIGWAVMFPMQLFGTFIVITRSKIKVIMHHKKLIGVIYKYSGREPFQKFDRKLCKIAKLFGAIETEYLEDRIYKESYYYNYWYGFLSSDYDSFILNNINFFDFPKETNKIISKWFNHIYDDFSVEDTLTIWEEISKHPEIKKIHKKVWNELKQLAFNHEGWCIKNVENKLDNDIFLYLYYR